MEKIGLEAVLELAGFKRAIGQYQKFIKELGTGMKGFGISSEVAGDAVDRLLPIVGAAGLVAGGATAAFYALNKAMEFGKQGATIDQTRQSFMGLMDSMGIAPTILEEMRAATNNTVDDMTLMSSTMTLVAGTSDRLGSAMVGAAPRLLEIAKAANKLNPTLGDTAFLYSSLATGIKRNSPLLLDNLGLIVKVGAANEAMAKKLGKSVQALSAEEKQMALLEATMEAGERMIDQVGGTTEAAGDSFAAAEVALKNLTDQIKADSYPALVDLFETIGTGIGYVSEAYETFTKLNTIIQSLKAFKTALYTLQDPMEAFNEEFKRQSGLAEEEEKQMARATITIKRQATVWANEYTPETFMATRATEAFTQAQEELTVSAKDLESAQKALDKAIQNIRKSYEGFLGGLAKGLIKQRELGEAQVQSAKDYEKTIADLNAEAGKSLRDVQEKFEASLPDATTVQDRMGMAGDAWDEWGLRIQDIIEQGVASPWYAQLEQMGMSKPPDVGMREWAEDLKAQFYAGQLPDLLPPEWAANVRAQQEEATRVVQAENAKRRAEAEAARQAELEAERQARNQATIELALTLAEQSHLLQAWSMEKFGPDFSQVADSADEVMALLQSGMLEIDEDLQGIIENSVAGIQQSLDTTGTLAEETQNKLDTIASTDWVQQKKDQLDDAFDMNRLEAPWTSSMATLGALVPKTPFDPMFWNFEDSKNKILEQSGIMELGLTDDFGDIEREWVAMVAHQVRSWDKGMSDIERAIQEKVLDKLEEIPEKITIVIETEQEGGTPVPPPPEMQHGGVVQAGMSYLVGERGPEMFVPERPGTILPHELTMALPALLGMAGGGGGTIGPTVNVTMYPTINNGMDLAQFELLTERTVQRAIRGI